MSEVPVYLIAHFIIHDAASYRIYEKQFFPILKRHGGEFLTYDDDPETFEGEEPMQGRVVLLKFPNESDARTWYSDPEYQRISEHRRAGIRIRFFSMIHGIRTI
ncbi:MAG: DUF1330 domain-containing protein [Haliea sp.]